MEHPNLVAESRVAASRDRRARSGVTNGSRLFVSADGRGLWARRWRDLVELHAADLGGADTLSEAQMSLVKRCSTIELELERMEGRLSGGEVGDLDAYCRAANSLRRVLESLGIERAKRPVTSLPALLRIDKISKAGKWAELAITTLARWRANPVEFIEQVLHDPETGAPYQLLPAERAFLEHAFQTDDSGRLRYPEQVYGAPKKSGKTAFAALHCLTVTLLFGGHYPEATICANDFDQAVGRVFEAIKKITECSPHLRAAAKITSDKIIFPEIGVTITAIPSDYAGAAGGNPTISVFDELWAYTSERSRRLWDELVPPPTRKIACRLTATYAGFEGESALLEELYKRGLQQPLVGTDLYAGGGLLMFWSHGPIAPWQTPAWIEQMRGQLRPNAFLRMIENRFVTTESAFIDMDWWDRCVDPELRPALTDKRLAVWVGVDASVKRDSTAVVAVAFDAGRVRLVAHRIFQPTPKAPLDFEATIERTVKEYCSRFAVRAVHYDPYQMASSAQRLRILGVPMREFPQSVPNLTAMGSRFYEMIKSGGIVVYPDDAIRLAVSRAIAKETPRGLQLTKEKSSHKIDVVIALAMAALHAVEQGTQASQIVAPIYLRGAGAFYPAGFDQSGGSASPPHAASGSEYLA